MVATGIRPDNYRVTGVPLSASYMFDSPSGFSTTTGLPRPPLFSLLRTWQPLLGGLLSGLEAQSELSKLLDELYYDGLK